MKIRAMLFVLVLAGSALAQERGTADKSVHAITLPEERVVIKPGAGMEQTSRYCSICHSLDYITTQPPFPAEKWGAIVSKMVKVFGAPIPADVSREITAYLGAAYGKSGP